MKSLHRVLSVGIMCGLSLLLTAPAPAQETPKPVTEKTAATEPFQALPKSVAAGKRDVTLRLVASKSDMFSSSSAKQPTLKVSSGAEVVAGSFKVLNPSEAEAKINVTATAPTALTVTLTFYSVDGKTAIRQERATIGVTGTFKPTGASAEVGTGEVRLIQVNVPEPQRVGDVLLAGGIGGRVELTPPTGTVWSTARQPQVTFDKGNATIQGAGFLNQGGIYAFNVVNGTGADVTIRVGNLHVDASKFGHLGGVSGSQTAKVSALQLGAEAVLVVVAHLAMTTLEGDAVPQDSTETPATNNPDPNAPTTPTTPTTGSTNYPSASTNRDERDRERAQREEEQRLRDQARNNANPAPNAPVNQPVPNANPARPPVPQSMQPQPGLSTPPAPPGGGSGGAATGVGGRTGDAGTKPAETDPFRSAPTEAKGEPAAPRHSSGAPDPLGVNGRATPEVPLRASNGLYFADSSWKRTDGVVLDGDADGGRAQRVWIVLELAADRTPARDTVTVTLRIGGTSRSVTLTETGDATGVFRCDAAGVEIFSPR